MDSRPPAELCQGGGSRTLELRLRLPALPRASADARQALANFEGPLSPQAHADLRMIVTELVTNGVKYGPGGVISVSVALDSNGSLRGDVDDGGDGGVQMLLPREAPGGLGLRIVDGLASSWGVCPSSSRVWFELDAATVI